MVKQKINYKTSTKKGIMLTCQRCNHSWIYRGESDWYTSCGNCKAMVNVRKRKLELGLIKKPEPKDKETV